MGIVVRETDRLNALIGDFLLRVLRGGTDLSAVTLARFFAVHIWFLPAIMIATVGIHLYLLIRIGISDVPKEEE